MSDPIHRSSPDAHAAPHRLGPVTWLGLGVVAAAAAVLSFSSLRRLAVLSGTPIELAWLLPVCIDAGALVATRLWLATDLPDRAHRFARSLALATIALSVLGNAVSHALIAYQVTPPWWAVVAVAAVPPAVLGAVAHLAALARPSATTLAPTPTSAPAPVTPEPAPAAAVEPGPPEPRQEPGDVHQEATSPAPASPGDLMRQARELVNAGEAEDRKVGRATLARELGISEHQARQVLRQLDTERRPTLHAVGGDR